MDIPIALALFMHIMVSNILGWLNHPASENETMLIILDHGIRNSPQDCATCIED